MVRYAAFLRGINVGGRKPVKMEDLREAFASQRFGNVKTYLQSGNVTFDARSANTGAIEKKIGRVLAGKLGHDIEIFVRTITHIEELLRKDPFAGVKPTAVVKTFVTFLQRPPAGKLELPLVSPRKDVEVFCIRDLEAFSLSRKKQGRFGFPNNFIEAEFGMPATTRSWDTVKRIGQASR